MDIQNGFRYLHFSTPSCHCPGSLLGYPTTCDFRGVLHSCTLSLACWLVGGTLTSGCGGDMIADWLFTCCITAHGSGSGLGHHSGLQPVRRWGLHHEKQVELKDHLASVCSKVASATYEPRNLAQFYSLGVLNTCYYGLIYPHLLYGNKTLGQLFQAISGKECGTPVMGIQKRIIGGAEAYFGELPWQAHIRISGYQCGGVLLSQRYVATAAHCVYRARLKDILVYLGEYDTQNTAQHLEPMPEEAYRVIGKIVHPNFEYRISQPDRYDVALVRLARPAVFRENILPICLPQPGDSFSGQTGIVAGWGKTDTTYGKTGTNILQKALVPILSDEKCLIWHKHKRITVELYEEMFCAGHSDGRMDACLGDSGGPLVVFHSGRQKWILAGITSAGFGCAVDHQPGIYHKVAHTARWISANIQQ